MKLSQLSIYGSMAIATGMFVGGCTDELFSIDSSDKGGGQRMEFSAIIDQNAATRADESGFADGDRFGVFVVNYSDGQPGELTTGSNHVNNLSMTFDAENNEWKAASEIYWMDKKTPADVYGYYPYDNGMGNVRDYRFEVESDQSKPAEDGSMCSYEASDLLWAKAATVAPGQRVSLSFRHAMAGVKVELKKGNGFEGDLWQKLTRIVTIDNTTRISSVDLQTGAVTADGSADRSIVMSPNGNDTYRGIVVPQSVPEGKAVISVTIDGISYSLRRQAITKYTSGKLHNFTITIDRNAGEGTYALKLNSESITDWEADTQSHSFDANSYLVVDVPEAGHLKECLLAINCDITTLRNLKVKGLLTESDFSMMREEMHSLTSINLKDVRIVNIMDREYKDGKWSEEEKRVNDMLPSAAFRELGSLRRVVLPDGITRIGAIAFEKLKLTSTLIIPESVTVIENGAFEAFGEDAAIIMPSTLEWIGSRAFCNCMAKTELRLGNSVKYIGDRAFMGARGMTGFFSLPQNLDYLGESAFADCGRDMTGDIEIPIGMKEIPYNAFRSLGFGNGTNLILPEGLKTIGPASFAYLRFRSPVKIPESVDIIGEAAFVECHFAEGRIILPKEVKYIDRKAIAWTNASGTLEYPKNIDAVLGRGDGGQFGGNCFEKIILGDNVLQIQTKGFEDSKELKYLEIGKNVNFIGELAFAGSPQLATVVCLATEPPKVHSSAFTDVYFDKCVLEVPEKSIVAYRNATGWNQFRNITAHKDLAVNIPDIACLDKGAEREGMVRAESAWSVTECPSWVHVSPSKGTYKDNINIKVDAMPAGSTSREGRITFSLDGKNYTTYTTVRQLEYEYAEDTEITLQSATGAGNEIPVFIVGEGFDAEDITGGIYMEKMRETMEYLFAIEPFRSYRDRFTVTTSISCSPESGTGDIYNVRQNCFDSDGVRPNVTALRQYVQSVSAHAGRNMSNALIIMVSNYNSFAGWSSIEDDKCSIASVGIVESAYPYDQRGLVQHYAGGEAFAGLGNEAVTHFEHIKGCTCANCNALCNYQNMKGRGFYANLTMSSKMGDAPWRDFISHPKYSQSVDMWEGGYNHYRGVWRSEPQSVMGTYIAYFNTISRYTIYNEIMRRSGRTSSISDFMEQDKTELRQ